MFDARRLIVTAIGTLALAAGFAGCQVRDGFLPTEADRSIETSASKSEILAMIDQVITNPAVGKSARSQFNAIAKAYPKKPAEGQAKAKSLIDFILKHYTNGKWSDPGGAATGELIAAIAAYVGLLPEDADAATACVPNADCDLFATQTEELALIEIPGDAITVPFVLVITKLPDDFAQPPLYPQFFEFSTIPEGITFPPSSASGSLTLSQFDNGPLGAVCALDDTDPLGTPPGAVPGENLFLAHQEGGVWVQLDYVPVANLDCTTASSGIGESAGLWSSPIDLAIGPMIDLLSPASATAGGRGLGGAISSFSPFGGLYTGPLPTTTQLSVVSGGPVLHPGETITLKVVVTPTPPDSAQGVLLLRTAVDPPPSDLATTVALVGGEGEHSFECGSPLIPVGESYEVLAHYRGAEGFEVSDSTEDIAFSCEALAE